MSVLLCILILVIFLLVLYLYKTRYRSSSLEDELDELDGSRTSRGSRQIYKIADKKSPNQNGICKASKKRNKVKKRESSKSLLRSDANEKNSVYQPTVEDAETENLKTAREMDDLSGIDAKPTPV